MSNKAIGYAPCPNCSAQTIVRKNSSGDLYQYCVEKDGCEGGWQNRSRKGKHHKGNIATAKRITKWFHKDEREWWLNGGCEAGGEGPSGDGPTRPPADENLVVELDDDD